MAHSCPSLPCPICNPPQHVCGCSDPNHRAPRAFVSFEEHEAKVALALSIDFEEPQPWSITRLVRWVRLRWKAFK